MAVVVDTNVAMVASRLASQADERCIATCIDTLAKITQQGGLLVDESGLILREYTRSLGYSGQPGAGHAFAKWAHDHQSIPSMVRLVQVTRILDGDWRMFAEFPDRIGLASFDKSDQKFVAVAVASASNPPILNAIDSDWWHHRLALEEAGVSVEFLCPHDAPK